MRRLGSIVKSAACYVQSKSKTHFSRALSCKACARVSVRPVSFRAKLLAKFVPPLLLSTLRRRGRGMRCVSAASVTMNHIDKRDFFASCHLRKTQTTDDDALGQLFRNRRRCNKKLRRQHPTGVYFVDFYCEEERLVIEIDTGSLHQKT